MTERLDPFDQGREQLERWLESQVENQWPDAMTSYRGRARNGDHHWEIQVPTQGRYWVAATDDVLSDADELRRAEETLERNQWLDRLTGVKTRGILLKSDGRIMNWDRDTDEEYGFLE